MTSTSANLEIVQKPRTENVIREVVNRFRVVRIYQRTRVVIENKHPIRTAISAAKVGAFMGVKNLEEFKTGSVLHDIGKCHEDLQGLMKILGGKVCTDEQLSIIRSGHTKFGPDMLDLLEQFAGFKDLPYDKDLVRDLCLYHHPEIDLERRHRRLEVKILSVVDKFDACTSNEDERSYREKPFTESESIEKLAVWALDGTLDPEVVQVFVEQCLEKKLPKFN